MATGHIRPANTHFEARDRITGSTFRQSLPYEDLSVLHIVYSKTETVFYDFQSDRVVEKFKVWIQTKR
ncbi:hypothetical protein D3C85_1864840 [compost metagenome]